MVGSPCLLGSSSFQGELGRMSSSGESREHVSSSGRVRKVPAPSGESREHVFSSGRVKEVPAPSGESRRAHVLFRESSGSTCTFWGESKSTCRLQGELGKYLHLLKSRSSCRAVSINWPNRRGGAGSDCPEPASCTAYLVGKPTYFNLVDDEARVISK